MSSPNDPCEAVYLRCALPEWEVESDGDRLSQPSWLTAGHQSGLSVSWVKHGWGDYLTIDASGWAFMAHPELEAVRRVHLLDRRAVQPC